jgi:hypothetical protein
VKPPQVFLIGGVILQLRQYISQVAAFGGYCLLLRF